ncbi:MAG: hypothetical protein VXX34_05000, partial [Candidatus Thermoplasmatota archaeon]|nr:hypothetical protein [Candidatus Thermoplasmatota archaeon]
MTTGDGNDVFWDSGWQSGAAAPAPQQPAILPANPVSSNQPSIAIGANAATGGSMSAKPKRSIGGPKHPIALGILVVVALGLIIGNVALVNASNAYVPWSEVDATVVGGPITPEDFLTTATVYLDENNGTAYYEDRYERSSRQCSTQTDEYGETYQDCWTEYWTEYECYADLDLRWTVNGTEHQAWEYSPTLVDGERCLSAIEEVFAPGTNLTIAVNPNDPSSHQAFRLALMTEVDEDHPGFRTGYTESSYLEWAGYGRAVLVSVCSMDAAVAYTFDGEEYVRDIWGESPATEGWGSSCLADYIESFGPGSVVTVMVDTENPSEAGWEDPTTDPGAFIGTAMCCSVIVFLAAFVLTGKGGTVRPPIRHHSQFDHHPSRHHRYRGRHRRRHHGHTHRSSRSSGSSHRSSRGSRSSGGGGRSSGGGGR